MKRGGVRGCVEGLWSGAALLRKVLSGRGAEEGKAEGRKARLCRRCLFSRNFSKSFVHRGGLLRVRCLVHARLHMCYLRVQSVFGTMLLRVWEGKLGGQSC